MRCEIPGVSGFDLALQVVKQLQQQHGAVVSDVIHDREGMTFVLTIPGGPSARQLSVERNLRAVVVVLDRELKVHAWNLQAEDLWGIRTEEAIGRSFFDLDFGFPAERIKALAERSRDLPGSPEDVTVEAHNRQGQSFQCRATVAPLAGQGSDAAGVIVLMENVSGSQRP